ncbi:hypothetical protein SDC9_165208 [bioreactor metagenome]|uniref:Uncharacterized protein n=1 Tax=bioreactor metagenome TaxID=1076179 RepID=A0A645G0Z3_9ZZZZ
MHRVLRCIYFLIRIPVRSFGSADLVDIAVHHALFGVFDVRLQFEDSRLLVAALYRVDKPGVFGQRVGRHGLDDLHGAHHVLLAYIVQERRQMLVAKEQERNLMQFGIQLHISGAAAGLDHLLLHAAQLAHPVDMLLRELFKHLFYHVDLQAFAYLEDLQ